VWLPTHVSRSQALVVGVAGLVGGAMSMAAGEYVSVSSQADSERSDLERERRELAADEPPSAPSWPASMCSAGWSRHWPSRWRLQLMQPRCAGGTRPRRARLVGDASGAAAAGGAGLGAASFATGALLPLLVVLWSPVAHPGPGARRQLAAVSGAARRPGGTCRRGTDRAAALRVSFWGALAMAVTAAVGSACSAPSPKATGPW
jgi:VIT1/CCC1 family predicted Fe2+/Mn2+ transporter